MIVMSAKVLLYFGTLSIIETHHTGHASAQNIDDSGYYIHTILTESINGLLYHIYHFCTNNQTFNQCSNAHIIESIKITNA